MSEVYMSNKEQVQLVKDWWKKYGSTVLTAIVVFLAVNLGMRYWKQHVAKQQILASIAYSQMIEAEMQNKSDEAKLFAKRLVTDFSRSPYASFASMTLAKYAVNENNFGAAKQHLEWVIQHAKRDELRELARLREARILLAENKPKEAISLLQENKDSIYATAKYETIGDAWLTQQDVTTNKSNISNGKKNAVANYRKALSNGSKLASPATSPLLKIKAEQLSE